MKVRWKRSTGDHVESHCGWWWITPIYGGLTRPERYELRHNASRTDGGWKVVGSGQTQHECKAAAADIADASRGRPSPTTPEEKP